MAFHKFLEDAKASLAGAGRYGTTYRSFMSKYAETWNRDFEEDAQKAGFPNGVKALQSCPDDIEVSGTNVKYLGKDENSQEIFRVMEVASAARKEKPPQNSNRKAKAAPVIYVKKAVGLPSSNQAQSSSNGPNQVNVPHSAKQPDPYGSDDDGFGCSSYNQIRNYPPKPSTFSHPINSAFTAPIKQNGTAFTAPIKQSGTAFSASTNPPAFSVSPSQSVSETEKCSQVKPQIPQELRQSNHNQPPRSQSVNTVIIKDGVFVFEDSLEEIITSLTKKLNYLFTDVLDYGNENTLPADIIRKFIENNDFKGRLKLKDVAKLITMFTEWQASIEGLRVVFVDTKTTEIPTLVDNYSNRISIPKNEIEMSSIQIAKIIGITDKNEFIIRPSEWNVKYANFVIGLRHYYEYFEQNMNSIQSEFSKHVVTVFASDAAFLWDRPNLRFVRCVVSSILKSGDVIVFAIDEGFFQQTSPANLYSIPHKFRQLEPLCLTFEMRMKDLSPVLPEKINGLLVHAQKAMQKGIECKFKIKQKDPRQFIPDLYKGPWAPII